MSGIYLIGIDHLDKREGPKKLERMLDTLHPDVLVDEFHEPSFRFICNIGERLRGDLEKLPLSPQKRTLLMENFYDLAFPFPTYNVWQYAQAHGIPHYFGDARAQQAVVFPSLEEMAGNILLLGKQHPERITPSNLQMTVDSVYPSSSPEYLQHAWEYYLRTERRMGNELTLSLLRLLGKIGKRDRAMEGVVREVFRPEHTLVFPIGMVHVTDSMLKSTLYSRIKDLHPKRLPLV